MYRIHIIEDDPALAQELATLLRRWQYDVTLAERWDDLLTEVIEAQPHLVLLDVNLPTLDGFSWCARIRRATSLPVLFLSARDAPSDAIRALENGGDDYLTKPCSPNLLVTKVAAILRRAYEYQAPTAALLSHQGAVLDLAAATLTYGQERITLSLNELKLLRCLMERRGEIVSRAQLMQLLWDDDVYVNENSLTVSVNRLRKRLADVGLPDFIATKKGTGYGLVDS